MAISTALSLDLISRAVGYKLKATNFSPTTPYLPQRIKILAEGNTANQASFTEDVPFEFTSANEVGAKFGYGSPAHSIARILRPKSGNLLGGIPTVIYPQAEAGGATATVITDSVAVAGSAATANTTHYVVINGRKQIDGQGYNFSVAVDDDADDIIAKIVDAVNGVSGSPVIAAAAVSPTLTFTTKWAGDTAAELVVTYYTGDEDAGVTYTEDTDVDGAGTPDISGSLGEEDWNTLVINSYGSAVAATLATLEVDNGVPDPDTPTGRYSATNWKPYMAFFGSVLSTKAGIIAITDAAARKTQVTNVLCPAPGSTGFTWEAAANMVAVFAPIAQNLPHRGIGGKFYPDMPVPADADIGEFKNYTDRDYMAKRGSSTVNLTNGLYTIQDVFTTYHPTGDALPAFRYVRDMNVYFNLGYGWILIMVRDIQDNVIVADDQIVKVQDVVSPKQVKQMISSYAEQNALNALIADVAFTEASAVVGINESNPKRLDIFFRTKITSPAEQVSTDNEVGFNFKTT